MHKKDKVLTVLLAIIAVLSIAYTYYKTIYKKDFEVIDTTPAEELDSEQ